MYYEVSTVAQDQYAISGVPCSPVKKLVLVVNFELALGTNG